MSFRSSELDNALMSRKKHFTAEFAPIQRAEGNPQKSNGLNFLWKSGPLISKLNTEEWTSISDCRLRNALVSFSTITWVKWRISTKTLDSY